MLKPILMWYTIIIHQLRDVERTMAKWGLFQPNFYRNSKCGRHFEIAAKLRERIAFVLSKCFSKAE